MQDDKTAKIIERIRAGSYSERELINLWNNASERGNAAVADAVRRRMRADFPRAANRMFGAKENEAMALLEDAWARLNGEFELGANRVRNGVKAGGTMLSGERHIDLYISYKTDAGVGVFLSLTQDDADAELVATVAKYKSRDESYRKDPKKGTEAVIFA